MGNTASHVPDNQQRFKRLSYPPEPSTGNDLDLLLNVLPVISKAFKLSKERADGQEQSLKEPICAFRTLCFAITHTLKSLEPTSLVPVLSSYVERVLSSVEGIFVYERFIVTKSPEYRYPRLHAVYHYFSSQWDRIPEEERLFNIRGHINLEVLQYHGLINGVLTECLDELQSDFAGLEDEEIATAKYNKRPPSHIRELANRSFCAFSRCRANECEKHEFLEACLMLGKHAHHHFEDDGSHLDYLFAVDSKRHVWEEVRIYTTIPDYPGTRQRVKFAMQDTQRTRERWWLPSPPCYSHVCQTLGQREKTAKFRLNLVLEDIERFWVHRPTKSQFVLPERLPFVSLQQLLSYPMKEWSEMQKRILSVLLAYSLFYLYDGPWIANNWSGENIIFFKNENSIPLRPFLRASFSSSNDISQSPDSLWHNYPALLTFAVTLLEIHLGEPLESFLTLAKRLVTIDEQWTHASEVFAKREKHIMGRNYRRVIRMCLDPGFGLDEICEGEELLDLIYTTIVAPLEEELNDGFSEFLANEDLDDYAATEDIGSGLNLLSKAQSTYTTINSPGVAYNDYSVGWICALPKEQTAAIAMLDEKHPDLPLPPNDHNAYTLGRVGEHNVAIACLPKGDIGNSWSTAVATQMNRTFPSLRFILMVGIAGGVPSKVRLGDVVVSSPSGPFGGVVQWDFGKTEEKTSFRRTGSSNKPPGFLRTALTKLESKHEISGSDIPKYLDEMNVNCPRLPKKYTCRSTLRDPLCEVGDGQIISRAPEVYYGLIASGNQVIKDAKFRDQIDQSLDGLMFCFEMEAAGIMIDFPCLVIRGICDYADSNKNKDWQEYAASVAAAYAKEFLSVVPCA